jgi:hypothetical protein
MARKPSPLAASTTWITLPAPRLGIAVVVALTNAAAEKYRCSVNAAGSVPPRRVDVAQ